MYLPPFEDAVDAGVGSVMASFNTVNGRPVHANRRLLTGLLKGELGFTGAVVGDATMVDALAPAVDVLETSDPSDLPGALRAAVTTAHVGAEATAEMVSRRGRASHFGQASIGHVDPGVRSMALLLDSAARHVICAVFGEK